LFAGAHRVASYELEAAAHSEALAVQLCGTLVLQLCAWMRTLPATAVKEV